MYINTFGAIHVSIVRDTSSAVMKFYAELNPGRTTGVLRFNGIHIGYRRSKRIHWCCDEKGRQKVSKS